MFHLSHARSPVYGWFLLAFPQPKSRIEGELHAPFFHTGGGDNTTLISDTRQQVGKHNNIERYCATHGIQVVRKCLSVGDYMISEDGDNPSGKISVDTKMSLLELSKDVMSSDHRRFRSECIRAQEQGILLIVLVEEEPPYGRVELWEVPRWKTNDRFHRIGDPMTMVNPKAFAKALRTMTEKYGVQFRFCSRSQTPATVIKFLKGEYK